MKEIIEEYYKKVNLEELNDEEKNNLKSILEHIEGIINSERETEGKFKIPDEIYKDLMQDIVSQVHPNSRNIICWENKLNSIIKLDGKIDKELGNYLYELYNNPNVSIGIHGTYHRQDFDTSDNNPYFKEGIKCKYCDSRRTVAFQDRGYIHAHGNISFINLLNYNYGAQKDWMTCEWKDNEDGYSREFKKYIGKDGTAVVQDNYIVVIPANMKTTEAVTDGKIPPKFILGTFRNSKWNIGCIERGAWDSFVRNSRFNLKEIENLNEEYKTKSQEEVTTDRLGKETIEEQQSKENVEAKLGLREKLEKLMLRLRNLSKGGKNSYRGE